MDESCIFIFVFEGMNQVFAWKRLKIIQINLDYHPHISEKSWFVTSVDKAVSVEIMESMDMRLYIYE